jgi:hypothetical protein
VSEVDKLLFHTAKQLSLYLSEVLSRTRRIGKGRIVNSHRLQFSHLELQVVSQHLLSQVPQLADVLVAHLLVLSVHPIWTLGEVVDVRQTHQSISVLRILQLNPLGWILVLIKLFMRFLHILNVSREIVVIDGIEFGSLLFYYRLNS